MEEWPETIVRAKGMIWLATRHDTAVLLSQAGPSIQVGPMGHWIAALSEEEIEQVLAAEPETARRWHPIWGDRVTELVLIGVDMDRQQVERDLDACLLTDEEMQSDWSTFPDPLPGAAVGNVPSV